MKVLNKVTDWENVEVSVSVTDLVELLLASYEGIDFDYPYSARKIMGAQHTAREAIFDCGYWGKEE